MAELTPKRIYGNQKRSLVALRKKIETMASEWGEVDNGTMWLLQGIADQIEKAQAEIEEFIS